MQAPPNAEHLAVVIVQQLPAILIATASVIGAIQSIRNGRKANLAAVAAIEASNKSDAIHVQTVKLSEQARTIQQMTDGQLSRVLGTNESLHELLTKMVAILSAREHTPLGVRSEDIPSELRVPQVPPPTDGGGKQRRATDKE
jgi:hypothetical protein